MEYQDEAWIKVFIRDTTTWLTLSHHARGMFLCLLRKLDRAGLMPLNGKEPAKVAAWPTSP